MKNVDKSYLIEISIMSLLLLDSMVLLIVMLTVKFSTLYNLTANTKGLALIVFGILLLPIQVVLYYIIYKHFERQEKTKILEEEFRTKSIRTVEPISTVEDLEDITRFYATFESQTKEVAVYVQYKYEDLQRQYEFLDPVEFFDEYRIIN